MRNLMNISFWSPFQHFSYGRHIQNIGIRNGNEGLIPFFYYSLLHLDCLLEIKIEIKKKIHENQTL